MDEDIGFSSNVETNVSNTNRSENLQISEKTDFNTTIQDINCIDVTFIGTIKEEGLESPMEVKDETFISTYSDSDSSNIDHDEVKQSNQKMDNNSTDILNEKSQNTFIGDISDEEDVLDETLIRATPELNYNDQDMKRESLLISKNGDEPKSSKKVEKYILSFYNHYKTKKII